MRHKTDLNEPDSDWVLEHFKKQYKIYDLIKHDFLYDGPIRKPQREDPKKYKIVDFNYDHLQYY